MHRISQTLVWWLDRRWGPSTLSRSSYNTLFTLGALIFSADHAQDIAIIIGPENGPRGPGKRFRVLGDFIAGQRKGIARKQDPFGLREGARGKERIDSESIKAELAANPCEHGPEIQRLVADVDRDHRCRPAKMLLVVGQCLACEEMHGDRVAGKRVQKQNVKLLEISTVGLPFERESRISKDNLNSAGRILQKGEVRMFAARQFVDVRVDFIEAVNVAGLRQRS